MRRLLWLPLQPGRSKKGLWQVDRITSLLTTLQIKREAGKEAQALLPEEQNHALLVLHSLESCRLSCSAPLFFSSPPSPCSRSTETALHAPALHPHVSCPAPPHLGGSSIGNDTDGCLVVVKHPGLLQWDLATGGPFSSPGEPLPNSASAPARRSSAQGKSFPLHWFTDLQLVKYSPLTSLVSTHTYTSTWSAAAGRSPGGGRAIDVPCMACHQLRKLLTERVNCLSSPSDVLHALLDEGSVPCLRQTPAHP